MVDVVCVRVCALIVVVILSVRARVVRTNALWSSSSGCRQIFAIRRLGQTARIELNPRLNPSPLLAHPTLRHIRLNRPPVMARRRRRAADALQDDGFSSSDEGPASDAEGAATYFGSDGLPRKRKRGGGGGGDDDGDDGRAATSTRGLFR